MEIIAEERYISDDPIRSVYLLSHIPSSDPGTKIYNEPVQGSSVSPKYSICFTENAAEEVKD